MTTLKLVRFDNKFASMYGDDYDDSEEFYNLYQTVIDWCNENLSNKSKMFLLDVGYYEPDVVGLTINFGQISDLVAFKIAFGSEIDHEDNEWVS